MNYESHLLLANLFVEIKFQKSEMFKDNHV